MRVAAVGAQERKKMKEEQETKEKQDAEETQRNRDAFVQEEAKKLARKIEEAKSEHLRHVYIIPAIIYPENRKILENQHIKVALLKSKKHVMPRLRISW